MPSRRRDARQAGVLPSWLELPGGLPSGRRIVFISPEQVEHIAARRQVWAQFCLKHLAAVIADPGYLGYRPTLDRRRVELVRHIDDDIHLVVALKFVKERDEAWVSTAFPVLPGYLTRRLRAGSMQIVSRGP